MSTMPLWGDERPATVDEWTYAAWMAKKRGITLPSLEAIARMKAEEGIVPAPDDGTPAGALTTAICLVAGVIGTIIGGFAIVSAVIGLAKFLGG
jgi:hypothetical protein